MFIVLLVVIAGVLLNLRNEHHINVSQPSSVLLGLLNCCTTLGGAWLGMEVLEPVVLMLTDQLVSLQFIFYCHLVMIWFYIYLHVLFISFCGSFSRIE